MHLISKCTEIYAFICALVMIMVEPLGRNCGTGVCSPSVHAFSALILHCVSLVNPDSTNTKRRFSVSKSGLNVFSGAVGLQGRCCHLVCDSNMKYEK